jgi:hypothetical protein
LCLDLAETDQPEATGITGLPLCLDLPETDQPEATGIAGVPLCLDLWDARRFEALGPPIAGATTASGGSRGRALPVTPSPAAYEAAL